MASPPSPPQDRDNVWRLDADLGFRPAMEFAGSVAAPLLAGFSFTLLVLLLPSFRDETDRVAVGPVIRTFVEPQAFSAVPELAAGLMLVAGLLLVGCVQAAVNMRYHSVTPSDLEEWHPRFFVESEGDAGITIGTRWYPNWLVDEVVAKLAKANFWGRWTRRLYHAGILSLLLGLAVAVLPPADDATTGRWVLFAVAIGGVLCEAGWVAGSQIVERRHKASRKPAPVKARTAPPPTKPKAAG